MSEERPFRKGDRVQLSALCIKHIGGQRHARIYRVAATPRADNECVLIALRDTTKQGTYIHKSFLEHVPSVEACPPQLSTAPSSEPAPKTS